MTRGEFLKQLKEALKGRVSDKTVQENICYYEEYIKEEITRGRSEREVLEMLGDPWILAKTIGDMQKASGGKDNYAYGRNTEEAEEKEKGRKGLWWKVLLTAAVVIAGIFLVLSLVTGIIRILMPVLFPVLVIWGIYRMWMKRH